MHLYNHSDSVNEKIRSAYMSVEERDGQLVGVLARQLTEPLAESEMNEFHKWWIG